jgi:hypothetical protein
MKNGVMISRLSEYRDMIEKKYGFVPFDGISLIMSKDRLLLQWELDEYASNMMETTFCSKSMILCFIGKFRFGGNDGTELEIYYEYLFLGTMESNFVKAPIIDIFGTDNFNYYKKVKLT